MCTSIKIAILAVVIVAVAPSSMEPQSPALPEVDPFSLLKDLVTRFTENADEIWTSVTVDKDCPVSLRDAKDSIDGVLIRSRIRPLSLDPDGYVEYIRLVADGLVYLNVDVGCLDREVGNPIFDIDVHFGINYLGFVAGNHPFDRPYLYALIDENFGAFGVGDRDYILDTVEESVEDAVTVFIAAHMDL